MLSWVFLSLFSQNEQGDRGTPENVHTHPMEIIENFKGGREVSTAKTYTREKYEA